MTTKETVQALLDWLPDDCSLEDVQYHLYVVQALEEGQADEAAGRVIPHEQVAAELRRKWLLGHAKQVEPKRRRVHSRKSSRLSRQLLRTVP